MVNIQHGEESYCNTYSFAAFSEAEPACSLVTLPGLNCTGFKNTGVMEDEGQYLQDIYLTDSNVVARAGLGSTHVHT